MPDYLGRFLKSRSPAIFGLQVAIVLNYLFLAAVCLDDASKSPVSNCTRLFELLVNYECG